MLKKTITYKDYNDVERTEDYYFNLSQKELTEMQLTTDGGLDEKLQKIVKAKSQAEIITKFKEIILASYGEKSDDGRYFIKKRNGVNLSEMFEQTEAFNILYMELATDDKKAAEFINRVIPQELQQHETPATIAANNQ